MPVHLFRNIETKKSLFSIKNYYFLATTNYCFFPFFQNMIENLLFLHLTSINGSFSFPFVMSCLVTTYFHKSNGLVRFFCTLLQPYNDMDSEHFERILHIIFLFERKHNCSCLYLGKITSSSENFERRILRIQTQTQTGVARLFARRPNPTENMYCGPQKTLHFVILRGRKNLWWAACGPQEAVLSCD
jgi:hypothetical protein